MLMFTMVHSPLVDWGTLPSLSHSGISEFLNTSLELDIVFYFTLILTKVSVYEAFTLAMFLFLLRKAVLILFTW